FSTVSAATALLTLSLHDALPIWVRVIGGCCGTTPEHIAAMRRALAEPVERAVDLTIPADLRSSRPAESEPVARPQDPTPFAQKLDRKSTRLNSSHEWISYAVFCL